MEEHVPVPMRVYIIRESSEMPQGDGETSAHGKTAEGGLKRS